MGNKREPNERQHYVPFSFFKNFKISEKEVSINPNKIQVGKIHIIEKETLNYDYKLSKDTAMESFLHDDDGRIESVLSGLERKFSRLLVTFRKNKNSFDWITKDNEELLSLLISFQEARVIKSYVKKDDEIEGLVNIFFENVDKYSEDFPISKKDVEIIKKEINSTSKEKRKFILKRILFSFHIYKEVNEMEKLFIINNTPKNIIFSDAPSIIFNPLAEISLFEKTPANISDINFFCFYMPLNTKLGVIFFDKSFFNSKENVIEASEKDIFNLNRLQSLHSNKEVYFTRKEDKDYIIENYLKKSYETDIIRFLVPTFKTKRIINKINKHKNKTLRVMKKKYKNIKNNN